jgi:hypothetical protein
VRSEEERMRSNFSYVAVAILADVLVDVIEDKM